ncbi:MAG: substrate-binding domain-containing protein [Chitinispirillales bacterium]|jgi:phosphate transport system substrate-binding protein|nr:substrate-binding domain-containing protein [Chitinispirillales bacterium]
MRKVLLLVLVGVVASVSLFCGGGRGERQREITVVSREAGSGTRGAFDEIMNIIYDGTDRLIPEAVVLNSTDAITSRVGTDRVAIGYTSLGSVSDGVRAVTIDGVAPTEANVQNNSYPIARPFVLANTGEVGELAEDFLKFVMSPAGQRIVSNRGLVPSQQPGPEYTPSGLTGTLSLSGSTSLERIIASLAEEYQRLNPNVRVDANHTGSGPGIRDAISGRVMLGMSSRALNASELEQLQATTFALDAIAVIVNQENEITNLSSEMVTKIFRGEVRYWGDVGSN